MQKDERTFYRSPESDVLETSTGSIICQSGNQSMGWQDFGDGGFTEK